MVAEGAKKSPGFGKGDYGNSGGDVVQDREMCRP